LLLLEATAMVPALLISLFSHEKKEVVGFAISIIILAFIGGIGHFIRTKTDMIYARDGFALVGLGWVFVSVAGMLPYLLTGAIPQIGNALFEAVSGFTTTNATIITNVEALPKGVLFWRSTSNWLGGMGVLVLMMALLPKVKANNFHVMQAEAPGPFVDKFVPKIGSVARILYIVYASITIIEAILLVFGGLSVFDAITTAMSTTSTGGFAVSNANIAEYNTYSQIVITIFMLAGGINLSLFVHIPFGKFQNFFKDEELRFFLIVSGVATLLISLDLVFLAKQPWQSIHHAAFQVSSIVTSTGFFSVDYNQWPTFSRTILIALMIMGGCAGSTAGGIKSMRILLMMKIGRRDIGKILHPRSVKVVSLNSKTVESETLTGILSFFFLYMAVILLTALVLSLDDVDLVSSLSASLAAISNTGLGLEKVGPTGNYAFFSPLSKSVLMISMLMGRLEIFPILILCTPSFWKKSQV
jgi:trk system potassium uptake protein TrkH